MNAIHYHDDWPDTFKNPAFWGEYPDEMTAAAWKRHANSGEKSTRPGRSCCTGGGSPCKAAPETKQAGVVPGPQSAFPPASGSTGASLTGTEPVTAPEGGSLPSGALVLRKLG